jgi:hypothetical protein
MIKRNFRSVPFGAIHLIESLKDLILNKGESIDIEDLRAHRTLKVYLKEFAESGLTLDSLFRVAVEWWLAILFDREIPYKCLLPCVEAPSWSLAVWKTSGGVIAKLDDEAQRRAAGLWSSFLWRSYLKEKEKVYTAWQCIKECCSRLFTNQLDRQSTVLFELIPEYIYKFVSEDPGITLHRKISLYIQLPCELPAHDHDSTRLETKFAKCSQRFS